MLQRHYKFYEFYAHPDRPELMAARAKGVGFSGIVVTNFEQNDREICPDDFTIYNGVEIQAKSSRIREEIRKLKNSNPVSIVNGRDEETIRAAVESEGLDILLSPIEFNDVIAKAAKENSVAIGFNLGFIIRLRGDARIRELKNMRTVLKHGRKYKFKMMLTCDPCSVHDLRSPREMVVLSSLFGMIQSEAIDAISATPIDIIRRKGQNYIQEGIEIL